MIYIFTGSDEQRARKQAFLWVAAVQKKEPNVTYVRVASEELNAGAFDLIIGAGALFVNRLLVLLDDPYAVASSFVAAGDKIDTYVDDLAHTSNVVVIIAPRLITASQKLLLEKATKVYVFDKKTSDVSTRGFNSALVNALGERNSEKLWLEIVRAYRAGDAPEMIHGLLHWKARELMKKRSRAWSPTSSRALSLTILELLGNARRTGSDLSLDIEQFALSLERNI